MPKKPKILDFRVGRLRLRLAEIKKELKGLGENNAVYRKRTEAV